MLVVDGVGDGDDAEELLVVCSDDAPERGGEYERCSDGASTGSKITELFWWLGDDISGDDDDDEQLLSERMYSSCVGRLTSNDC